MLVIKNKGFQDVASLKFMKNIREGLVQRVDFDAVKDFSHRCLASKCRLESH